MGYFRHQAVVVVMNDFDDTQKNAIEAFSTLQEEMGALDQEVPNPPCCIVGPVTGINGYYSWAFLPDGSKEGWNPSDTADDFRERFIEIAQSSEHASVVELQLGGDDGLTRILSTTDHETIVDVEI